MIWGHCRNTPNDAMFPPGADIVRLHDGGCRWALIEPSRGVYNWAKLDAYLAANEARGLATMYTFSSTPAWCAQPVAGAVAGLVDKTSNCPPLMPDFIAFLVALVKHVSRPDGSLRIQYWEAWNEANYAGFWSGTDAQLLELCQAVYGIVKSADPTCQVTTPSCVYSYAGNNILTALPRWLAKGIHKYADIIAVHGYQVPYNLPAAGIGPVFDQVNGLLANLKITLPVWDTEFGFGDPALVKDPRQWVIDALQVRLRKGIAGAIWYQADNPTHGAMRFKDGTLTAAGQAWVDTRKATVPLPAATGILQL
jgi:hypothetical protein